VRFPSSLIAVLPLVSVMFVGVAHAEEPSLPSATAGLAPAPLPADVPPPAARTNALIAGIATTAVAYGLALSTSFLVDERDFRGAKQLRIPIAGPWLSLAKTGCPTNDPDCSTAPLVIGAILTIFDGVAQAGGLGIIGEGLFLKTSSGRPAQKAAGPTMRAVPLNFEKGGLGLGVLGTF
jgi:hypothetical protein